MAGPQLQAARARRAGAAAARQARIQWFIENVMQTVNLTLEERVRIATMHVHSAVVRNISRPVTKTPVVRKRATSAGPKGSSYTLVTDRSKKGEYPKADTTQMLKTVFQDFRKIDNNTFEGYVGTPLDYGLILEVNPDLDRKWLVKTLIEETAGIKGILVQPLT